MSIDTNQPAIDAADVLQIADMLRAMTGDKPKTLSAFLSATHEDLRRIAHSKRLQHAVSDTMSTTALVNEFWLKMQQSDLPTLASRRQFFALAARGMRQILIDYARRNLAEKRGAGVNHESLESDVALDVEIQQSEQILEMSEALEKLGAKLPRLAEVVYLRFYAGLSDREISMQLNIDERTVRRDWIKARGWMLRQMGVATEL
jgi:RNA polymerase sigma factor (TIGR02999 family)